MGGWVYNKMSNSDVDIGLVQQLDSARADIQFLSKNHAETLKGLHSEIKSLQQSNRELQFQLTFAKTNDELELKINQLEKENTKYKSKMNEMKLKTEVEREKHNEQCQRSSSRILKLEKELDQTINSYQALILTLEKQNEQQAAKIASLERVDSGIRRLPVRSTISKASLPSGSVKPPSSPVWPPSSSSSNHGRSEPSRPVTPRRLPPLSKKPYL